MTSISFAACIYALRELSRRAGVTRHFFLQWQTEMRNDMLLVRPQPGNQCEIRFPFFSGEERQDTEVVYKSWAAEAPREIQELVPDLIVPFCRRGSIAGQPLFLQLDQQTFSCTEDLLTSILLTLCRFEETNSSKRDSHGRFPASASIAMRYGFLRRPIVDEYGLAFEQVVRILMPTWQAAPRKLRMKLSHDIDQLGIPFAMRSGLGHLLLRGAPMECARDFLSLASPIEPAYLHLVRIICRISMERGFRSALYWKASPAGPFDTGYDLRNSKIARVIDWARTHDVEMGVHPGYETFLSRLNLKQEVDRCRNVFGQQKIGGRQHFLRWCPDTWADWESCGLAYDSTVGFADHAGFRAGTCIPYRPWLWKQGRPADLLEVPLVVMDGTLVDYMKLDLEQSAEVVRELLKRCAVVGGVFSLLWHNTSLLPPFTRYYRPILDMLSGVDNYDWESDWRQQDEGDQIGSTNTK